MIDSSSDCFAQTYAEARSLFLRRAADAGLVVQSHAHPRAVATAKRWRWTWRGWARPRPVRCWC